ncbi:MAG: flagellar basal body L-ring protein FlgH [Desulfobacterales bacterium]
MSRKILCLAVIAFMAVAGCAGTSKPDPQSSRSTESLEDRSGRKEKTMQPASKRSGSIYAEGSSSLFSAKKASSPGDIVKVTISEQASAEKDADTSTGSSSSNSIGVSKIFGYEARLAEKYANLDPSSLLSSSRENSYQGSGSTSREETLSATLTTRVTGYDEAGNLIIEGSKTVRVNRENQVIRLSGIVRPSDITEYNTVASENILDAEIEYLGDGVISDKQGPGWMTRVLDLVWPF